MEDESVITNEKILGVIESLDDDVLIERAIDRLYFLYKIEIGQQQVAAGQGIDRDEFLAEFDAEAVP